MAGAQADGEGRLAQDRYSARRKPSPLRRSRPRQGEEWLVRKDFISLSSRVVPAEPRAAVGMLAQGQ